MNSQFDMVLVFVLIFALSFLIMKIMIVDRIPYGIRVVIGSIGMVIMIVLTNAIATYGR